MKRTSLGFIGGGRITRIFLQAMKNVVNTSIKVCDINQETLDRLKQEYPYIETSPSISSLLGQDVIFIALHPPVIKEVSSEIAEVVSNGNTVVSLAPKFTIKQLYQLLNTTNIIRVIPNATSFINKGFNPVCFSKDISIDTRKHFFEMLEVTGACFETEEEKLEAYAIVSAMLPTYFWFQWNEMEQIGQKIGLTAQESKNAVYESLKAALDLMYYSKLNKNEVVDLIPVKPIADKEELVKELFNEKLLALFQKIKPL